MPEADRKVVDTSSPLPIKICFSPQFPSLRLACSKTRFWVFDTQAERVVKLRKFNEEQAHESVQICQFSDQQQMLRDKELTEVISREDCEELIQTDAKLWGKAYRSEELKGFESQHLSDSELKLRFWSTLGKEYRLTILVKRDCQIHQGAQMSNQLQIEDILQSQRQANQIEIVISKLSII